MNVEIKEILSLLNSSSWSNESKILYDYITNLQKSQETLIKNDNEIITNLQKENEELKEQKKKAIEWIKKHITTYQKNDIAILDWDTFADPRNLLKILGGDK